MAEQETLERKDQEEGEEPSRALALVGDRDVAVRPKRRKSREIDENPPIRRTGPDELRRHDISDEELEMLSIETKDGLSEAFWGLTGASLAALPAALEAIWDAYIADQKAPLSFLHLVEITIVVGAAAGAFIVRRVSHGRGERVARLVKDIRARTATRA